MYVYISSTSEANPRCCYMSIQVVLLAHSTFVIVNGIWTLISLFAIMYNYRPYQSILTQTRHIRGLYSSDLFPRYVFFNSLRAIANCQPTNTNHYLRITDLTTGLPINCNAQALDHSSSLFIPISSIV